MSLEKIKETVLAKARAEAEALLAEARKAADSAARQGESRLRADHQHRVQGMQTELGSGVDRELAAREAELRRDLLEHQNKVLDELFEQVLDAIVNRPDSGYRAWLGRQLAAAASIGSGRIVCNERDRAAVGELLAGVQGSPELSDENADIVGGFLLEGDRFDLDFSVDTLVAALRKELLPSISAELFRSEESSA